MSGKSLAAKSALASSLRMLVSVIPGFTVFAVMPNARSVGATLRMKPTTACLLRS